VAVNPNDTEESIWCFLCEAQLQGPDQARDTMLRVRCTHNALLLTLWPLHIWNPCTSTRRRANTHRTPTHRLGVIRAR
jgi:hypothetical protein